MSHLRAKSEITLVFEVHANGGNVISNISIQDVGFYDANSRWTSVAHSICDGLIVLRESDMIEHFEDELTSGLEAHD